MVSSRRWCGTTRVLGKLVPRSWQAPGLSGPALTIGAFGPPLSRLDNPPPRSPDPASHAITSARPACRLASDPGDRPNAQSTSWPARSSAPASLPSLLRRWHERTTPAIPPRAAPRYTPPSAHAGPDRADVRYARPLRHKGPGLSPTADAFPTAIARR